MALLLSVITALNFICIALAYDESPLQDLCVADKNAAVRVNGFPCKDLNSVTVRDFLFRGLDRAGNNTGSTRFNTVDVTTFPGLNTQGLSLLRFDLLDNTSSVPPHTHLRAAEVIIVTRGRIEAGFMSGQTQYNINLTKGDVFVFPQGLVHYFRNNANGTTKQQRKSTVLAAFNGQLPGFTTVSTDHLRGLIN